MLEFGFMSRFVTMSLCKYKVNLVLNNLLSLSPSSESLVETFSVSVQLRCIQSPNLKLNELLQWFAEIVS